MRKIHVHALLVLLAAVFLVMGCRQPVPTVETAGLPMSTITVEPTWTPTPTITVEPTWTPTPTMTVEPTWTPTPTVHYTRLVKTEFIGVTNNTRLWNKTDYNIYIAVDYMRTMLKFLELNMDQEVDIVFVEYGIKNAMEVTPYFYTDNNCRMGIKKYDIYINISIIEQMDSRLGLEARITQTIGEWMYTVENYQANPCWEYADQTSFGRDLLGLAPLFKIFGFTYEEFSNILGRPEVSSAEIGDVALLIAQMELENITEVEYSRFPYNEGEVPIKIMAPNN